MVETGIVVKDQMPVITFSPLLIGAMVETFLRHGCLPL